MKRFLPYILILTILVQLLAPFSVGSGVKINKAEAADCVINDVLFNPLTALPDKKPTSVTLHIWTSGCAGQIISGLGLNLKDEGKNSVLLVVPRQGIVLDKFSFQLKTGEYGCGTDKKCENVSVDFTIIDNKGAVLATYSSTQGGSKRDDGADIMSYLCTKNGTESDCNNTEKWEFVSSVGTDQSVGGATTTEKDVWYFESKNATGVVVFTSTEYSSIETCTLESDDRAKNFKDEKVGDCVSKKVVVVRGNEETLNDTDSNPLDCGIRNFKGCVAMVPYYLLFVPTSAVFTIAGKMLDFTLGYSIQDKSYRSTFVVEGWGIVRDFCNMFFIFILLYIAFGTILNLHSVKTKEMIINVVIIGLLINFSLFATQVIVDASNILTRVFYNSETIKIVEKNADGTIKEPVPGSYIKLSEAIVSKVNPQELVLRAGTVGYIQDKGGLSTPPEAGKIGLGTLILVILLATAVNIVGIIVFVSVSLIFVTRVIGLWLAMIFSPFVFFSYTVPSLQDMEMVGWKKWWPETLKLAFLAPVFMFFMYLIVKFLNLKLDIINTTGKSGPDFVVSILLPFAFIMILLWKAKDIAKDMSGKMGQTITNGIAAAGGIALGGAALGTAVLGRRVIGQTMAKASRGDTATQKYQAALGDPAAMAKLTNWQKLKGGVGSAVGMGKVYGTDKGNIDPLTGKPIGVEGGIGGALNKKQKAVGDVDSARHKEDELKKASGLEGVDNSKLSGNDINTMEGKFKETERSNAEAAARKGVDAKGKAISIEDDKGISYRGEEEFKKAKMEKMIQDRKDLGNDDDFVKEKVRDKKGNVIREERTDQLKPEILDGIKNELNIKLSAAVKIAADNKLVEDFGKMRENASKHVNPINRVIAGSNKYSYDARKLSDIKSDKREGFFAKVPVALIAGIATGVRAGIKNIGLSNGGVKVEGNFMKDLGNTISDSLKSMKVNVDLSHVGETKSSADAHAGGAHH
ncbi:MAG: hypothetical protein WCT42_00405 [Candidatus Paceibacterota bacterium]